MLVCTGSFGDTPRTFTYQARISAASGDGSGSIGGLGPGGNSSGSGSLTTPTYTLRFTLYLDPEGYLPTGWSETHTDVPAPAGVVTVELGVMSAFPAGLFAQPLYLGVAIDSDPELTPRTALTNTPYGIQSSEALAQHQADASAHHAKTTSFTELTDPLDPAQLPADVALGSEVAAALATNADVNHTHDLVSLAPDLVQPLLDSVAAVQARVEALESQVSGLLQQLDDAQGGVATAAALLEVVEIDGTDVYFKGVNLHVVNDTGLGNLILGYNADEAPPNPRTGSHNLVVGDQHSYSAHSGIVAGQGNAIAGAGASVLAGNRNIASGPFTAVLGGYHNSATNYRAVVVGGSDNSASGGNAAVLGGALNNASGDESAVAGGDRNAASGRYATVGGGLRNTAGQQFSSIATGRNIQSQGAE